MKEKICPGTGGTVGLQDDQSVVCLVCMRRMEPIAIYRTVGLVPPHYKYLTHTGDVTIEGDDLENFKDASARFAFGMTRAEARAKGICIAGHSYKPGTKEEEEEYERSALCLPHLERFSKGSE